MLAICPDGTTAMVDAGAIYDPLKYTIAPKPDASRRPGEWLARYVTRHISAAEVTGIDYLLVTHLHTDHIVDYYSFFLSGGYTASKDKAPVTVYGPGPAGGLPPSQVGNADPATVDSGNPAPGLAATSSSPP